MLDSWGDNVPVPFCFFWQITLSKLKVCSRGFWSSFPGLSSNIGDYYYQQEWWQNYENTTQFVPILSVCLTRWLLVEQPTKRYKHSLFTVGVAQVHPPTWLPECLSHHLKMFNFLERKKILQIFEFPVLVLVLPYCTRTPPSPTAKQKKTTRKQQFGQSGVFSSGCSLSFSSPTRC